MCWVQRMRQQQGLTISQKLKRNVTINIVEDLSSPWWDGASNSDPIQRMLVQTFHFRFIFSIRKTSLETCYYIVLYSTRDNLIFIPL